MKYHLRLSIENLYYFTLSYGIFYDLEIAKILKHWCKDQIRKSMRQLLEKFGFVKKEIIEMTGSIDLKLDKNKNF